jgi:hypothetical protein
MAPLEGGDELAHHLALAPEGPEADDRASVTRRLAASEDQDAAEKGGKGEA